MNEALLAPVNTEIKAGLEMNSHGVLITDHKKEGEPIIFANDAFLEMTGYSREEVLGRNCNFLQGGDRNQPGLKELKEAIVNETEVTVVVKNYKKDGSAFWNEVFISPIKNENGETINFLGMQTDVSIRIEADKKIDFLEKKMLSLKKDMEEIIDTFTQLKEDKSRRDLKESTLKESVEDYMESEFFVNKIAVKDFTRHMIRLVDPAKILYVEKEDRKTVIHKPNENFYTNYTIDKLEIRLKPYGFIRISKGTLINSKFVQKLSSIGSGKYEIESEEIKDKKFVVNRSYSQELINSLEV